MLLKYFDFSLECMISCMHYIYEESSAETRNENVTACVRISEIDLNSLNITYQNLKPDVWIEPNPGSNICCTGHLYLLNCLFSKESYINSEEGIGIRWRRISSRSLYRLPSVVNGELNEPFRWQKRNTLQLFASENSSARH